MRHKKEKYYQSLGTNKITDNNTFWKTISLLFSNKSYSKNSKITLLKNREVLSEEWNVADTFSKFFSNVVKESKIEKDDGLLNDVIGSTNQVLKTTKKSKIHPIIWRMKSYFKYPKVFSFKYYNVEDVKVEINNISQNQKVTYQSKLASLTLIL